MLPDARDGFPARPLSGSGRHSLGTVSYNANPESGRLSRSSGDAFVRFTLQASAYKQPVAAHKGGNCLTSANSQSPLAASIGVCETAVAWSRRYPNRLPDASTLRVRAYTGITSVPYRHLERVALFKYFSQLTWGRLPIPLTRAWNDIHMFTFCRTLHA